MTDDELARWRLEQGRQAAAMTPEQMAEREKRQAIDMQNAMASYPHPQDLANAWGPYEPEPYTHKPTRMERLRAWLRNLWGTT